MPRLNSQFPRYRKHSSSDRAFIEIHGKRVYLPGPYGSKVSKAEYHRLIQEWEAAGRQRIGDDGTELTITELIAQYWKFSTEYYRGLTTETSEVHCIRAALRVVKQLYGAELARDFGPVKLDRVRNVFIKNKLARTTCNANCDRIKRMFRWAASRELIEGNGDAEPWRNLNSLPGLKRGRSAARETEPIRPIDQTTVDATLPHLSRVVSAMVRLQLLTGMRPAEVCQVRPCDIQRTGPAWRYTPQRHKNEWRGKDRVVLIGPKAQELLKPFLEREPTESCFDPREAVRELREQRHAARVTPEGQGNTIGTKRRRKPQRTAGKSYTTCSYRRAIDRACEAAGVERWAPNRLRHSAATNFRAVAGIEAASAALGHSELVTTQIYAERDLRAVESLVLKIG
ncbi:MAG: tyrosine-type recombinase/integrase [Planctomycetota bacterium]